MANAPELPNNPQDLWTGIEEEAERLGWDTEDAIDSCSEDGIIPYIKDRKELTVEQLQAVLEHLAGAEPAEEDE